MNEILRKIATTVIMVLATVSILPGFIVGSVIYLMLSIPFSLISSDSIRDYYDMYIATIQVYVAIYIKLISG